MIEERVRVLSTELLKPLNNLSNPPKFKLTAFDRIMRHVPYQLRVLFYKPPHPTTPFQDIVRLLKQSLEKVLVVFYPFAGRMLVGDGVSSPVLELDCGLGQSVKFTQAVIDATLEQLGCFEPSDFCDSLCGITSPLPKYPWSPHDPLLFVQVTKFGCGGISLGFALSHQASDGVTAWHFMNSWAEVATVGSVQVAPDITYSYREVAVTKEQVEKTESPSSVTGSHLPPEADNPGLATRKYTLNREMIEKLRAEAAVTTNGTRFSTFVVVSAYFWRKITLARQLPESTPTKFVVIVNTRERSALLSKSYFGNAASSRFLTLEAGEVERNDIGKCAALLHAKIAAWNEEESDKQIFYYDWLQTNVPQSLGRVREKLVLTVESPRQPVYETDFGFGKPVGVTFGTNDLHDGHLYLFPTPEGDGGVSATVVLNSDDMERLAKQDSS